MKVLFTLTRFNLILLSVLLPVVYPLWLAAIAELVIVERRSRLVFSGVIVVQALILVYFQVLPFIPGSTYPQVNPFAGIGYIILCYGLSGYMANKMVRFERDQQGQALVTGEILKSALPRFFALIMYPIGMWMLHEKYKKQILGGDFVKHS